MTLNTMPISGILCKYRKVKVSEPFLNPLIYNLGKCCWVTDELLRRLVKQKTTMDVMLISLGELISRCFAEWFLRYLPGKVMFLHLSVILFTGGEGVCSPDADPLPLDADPHHPLDADTTAPPLRYGQQAGGTHTTRMHTCFLLKLTRNHRRICRLI